MGATQLLNGMILLVARGALYLVVIVLQIKMPLYLIYLCKENLKIIAPSLQYWTVVKVQCFLGKVLVNYNIILAEYTKMLFQISKQEKVTIFHSKMTKINLQIAKRVVRNSLRWRYGKSFIWTKQKKTNNDLEWFDKHQT